MLVEGEGPNFIKDGFHMTYGWENHHAMNKIAQENNNLNYWIH